MSQKVDLILYNANVLTMDSRKPKAELVVVKGNKIIWVGGKGRFRHFDGPSVDCQGKTLVPGFIDAHCHIMAFAANFSRVDCSPFVISPHLTSPAVASIADIKDRIRQQARQQTEGTWIRAGGYNEFYLIEQRHPSRYDLDEVAPRHPVKLVHRTQHACVLNSLALSLVGISRETQEPPGGMIERDLETGEPNGILYEMNSQIDSMIPPLSFEEIEKGVKLANEEYLSCGITSLQDTTVTNSPAEWVMLQKLRERGYLAPRLTIMLGLRHFDPILENGFSPRYGDDGVRLGALKVVLSQTRGPLHPPKDELLESVYRAHEAGYQVAMHAFDMVTISSAIDAVENALEHYPNKDHRHRVEHCALCPQEFVERLKINRMLVVTQPAFIYYGGERYLKTIPEGVMEWLYKVGSFKKNGLGPAASSDSPVVPLNPMIGIYAAVTRKTDGGAVLLPEESVSPIDALRMYTEIAAYSSFDEDSKGTISVGKLADFALLSADPTQIPEEEIKNIKVVMTIIGGQVVWQS
jgi:predicted amidohydrolase YtcJ